MRLGDNPRDDLILYLESGDICSVFVLLEGYYIRIKHTFKALVQVKAVWDVL